MPWLSNLRRLQKVRQLPPFFKRVQHSYLDRTHSHAVNTLNYEAYANSMDVVVETAYDMFNRKFFSLPKVLLLPSVISKTPQMVVQIFPFIFFSDFLKGRAITYMTTRIETLQKEVKELSSMRSKIEAFDIKNAELLQRSGKRATQFTHNRWEGLSVQIQAKAVVSDLISRTKGFFAWIQRNFVFAVLVDCALANLIAAGKITSGHVFVFSRAIEDAVDMVLMKSRSEAELARMETEIEKLAELADIWEHSNSRSLIHCKLGEQEEYGITLRHVHYSRGTASVHAEHVQIEPVGSTRSSSIRSCAEVINCFLIWAAEESRHRVFGADSSHQICTTLPLPLGSLRLDWCQWKR